MDYDRNDAILHWIFRQTQGDAWFRPNEHNISSGVALRISNPNDPTPEFRVFPYENPDLEPFETAVAALNPAVAVKVRSAAVHAALAEIAPEDRSIYIDSNTRIQVLDSILHLPTADKEQCAAFIRDERVLVVWSDSLDRIVPTCNDFDDRLIKLLWRTRPPGPTSRTSTSATTTASNASAEGSTEALAGPNHFSSASSSRPASIRHISAVVSQSPTASLNIPAAARPVGPARPSTSYSASQLGHQVITGSQLELGVEGKPLHHQQHDEKHGEAHTNGQAKIKRTWYGKKVQVEVGSPELESSIEEDEVALADLESQGIHSRPVRLYAPLYNGMAAALAAVFIGNGIKILFQEFTLDSTYIRFALLVLCPLLYCISLFFALQMVQNVTMAIGPIEHYHQNSKYYSAIKPPPNKELDNALPHVTIQMPVYKESLEKVLTPSIMSIKRAMQTYARQGGTSTIFINDDGLRLLPAPERDARLAFYATHNIGWVARPKHDDAPDGFKRAGRFKKASNMNYGLALSLKVERNLEALIAARNVVGNESGMDDREPGPRPLTSESESAGSQKDDAQLHAQSTATEEEDLEEKALSLAIEEVYAESGGRHRPWAANGRSIRMGEIVLLVDSDTVVPEDCLRDAAREMKKCPDVAIIQHESDVMQVAHHYFENGIAYFTRRINRCISMACANGEIAPFMGHNAFLRWRAIQDANFIDPVDGKEKVWSESNVSEDFDMALRLMLRGYVIRWATYSKGGFKEGVSLSVDDELNRWQKYAYGCSELLFNPFVQWLRKGPISHQIHKFMWSSAPLHYKISMMAYMFSYYAIAASITVSVVNYVVLGFQFPVDGFYMHSFEIWLATNVVFFGSGTVGYTLLEYRLGHKQLIRGFFKNVMWLPFFFFFFGGLSIPLSQAMLAHLFSYNILWSATIKEVQRSNFFKEIPKIAKRFWFPMSLSFLLIVGIIVLATPLVPLEWRVDSTGWAVIFPVALLAGCHLLFPIVLNPWLMVFSY